MIDVVVIGAGVAGLTAAMRLEQAGQRCVVIDAASRVGGRVHTEVVGGETVDLGGEAVGRAQHRVRQLADELDLRLERMRILTRPVVWRAGDTVRSAALPTRSASELARLGRGLMTISRVASHVDPETPWANERGRALDRESCAALLDQIKMRGRNRELLEAAVGTIAGERAERVSALQLAWWIASAGGLVSLLLDATQYRISNGAQAIADALASRLRDEVVLGERADRVVEGSEGVTVESASGRTWQARAVVVAVPLTKVHALEFDPRLPPELVRLHRDLSFGRLTKLVGISDDPNPDRVGGLIGGHMVTAGWRRGRVVTGFAYGDAASGSENALFDDLAIAFGIRHWVDRRFRRWHDEPTAGGSYLVARPDQLTLHGALLTASHGRIHFAGSERSSPPGTIEGAVRSGEQICRTVLARLST